MKIEAYCSHCLQPQVLEEVRDFVKEGTIEFYYHPCRGCVATARKQGKKERITEVTLRSIGMTW